MNTALMPLSVLVMVRHNLFQGCEFPRLIVVNVDTVESEDSQEDMDISDHSDRSMTSSPTSTFFIEFISHPSSGTQPTYISLDGLPTPNSSTTILTIATNASSVTPVPWAPYRTRPDFEYAETVVDTPKRKEIVDRELRALDPARGGSWAPNGTAITFRSYRDVRVSLDAAKEYAVGVRYFRLIHPCF